MSFMNLAYSANTKTSDPGGGVKTPCIEPTLKGENNWCKEVQVECFSWGTYNCFRYEENGGMQYLGGGMCSNVPGGTNTYAKHTECVKTLSPRGECSLGFAGACDCSISSPNPCNSNYCTQIISSFTHNDESVVCTCTPHFRSVKREQVPN